jgi:hypoxanthine-DNA glycosylase
MVHLNHPFAPIYDENSRILILGTFPSAKSIEYGFYYGHKQNRFWKLIANLTKTESLPLTIEDKTQMLLKNSIALWDIIQSCDTKGSSDSNITNVIPNDLSVILYNSNIKKIFANGAKAHKISKKYSIDALKLPSTSPANAMYSFEKLIHEWSVILSEIYN